MYGWLDPLEEEEEKVDTQSESAKKLAVQLECQAIGTFLGWLSSKGIQLASLQGEGLLPYQHTINELLAEHFGIDQVNLEQERQAILAKFMTHK